MSFSFGTKSKQNMEGVDPSMIEIAELAIQLTVIDFGIPPDGGVRTAKRQNELFEAGKSKANGFTSLSRHQSGEALDFYAFVDGKASWEHEHLAMVAAAFLQAASILGYAVNWGGLWEYKNIINGVPYGWDMGHIERA